MNVLTYRRHSDYLIPNLSLPAEKECDIGVYGRRRLAYLKAHRPVLYTNLLTTCKLNAHLAAVNKQALDRLETLVAQMKKAQYITEELKAQDQLVWVGAMNNIRASAEEIINQELIYT